MLEVVRYRGKEGIYSWNVAQKGFNSVSEALDCIRVCRAFQKREYKYLICKEGTKLARFFEKNIDRLPLVCRIKN